MADAALIAIDQGTTSSRAMAFSTEGVPLAARQQEFRQYYPEPGRVEHDAEEIFSTTLTCLRELLEDLAEKGKTPLSIGITNQRETIVFWHKKTGLALGRAIVWQDRRTARECRALKEAGHEAEVSQKTGLLLDPYFSASKIAWRFKNEPELLALAATGELAIGTIDSWLLFRLTGGRHATDLTNASRTMLLDIHQGCWSQDLLDLFKVPLKILPEVLDSVGDFGNTNQEVTGAEIPVRAMIGDQQSAAIGQACYDPGAVKSTYGTGCFLMQNTGPKAVPSKNRLLTTIAWGLGGEISYALEGSIFVAGSAVKWLRDGLGILENAGESAALAGNLPDNRGVYLVPAFVGLGAPHWDAEARGALYGLSLDTGPAEIARAALESVAYQTHDLIEAGRRDGAPKLACLRVDGGMVRNDWFSQFLADLLGTPVDRPKVTETTALGAAFLAGLGIGRYDKLSDVTRFWQRDRRFEPAMSADQRESLLHGWQDAVGRTLSRKGGG